MYQGKHLKKFSLIKARVGEHELERKRSHFRAWKSGKKWLYAATTLVIVAGSLSGAIEVGLQNGVQFGGSQEVEAASSSSGTLVAGNNSKTPDVSTAYGVSDITNAQNTTLTANGTSYGNAVNSPGVISNWDSTGTLTLTNSILNGAVLGIGGNYDTGNSWGTFNAPLDMTQNLELDFSIKAAPNATLNTASQVGNWLGAYFVPVGTTFTNTSTSGGATQTAITGIANSFFLGRNYWYNNTNSNLIQVSQTNGSSVQSDVGKVDNFSVNSSGESVTVTWKPTSVGTSTTTGTLTMTDNNGTTTQSITGTVTMQNAMQLGFSGSNGTKGSKMTIYNVKTTTSAYAASKVTVKYVDKSGNQLAAPSTITTKLSDIIGVTSGGTVTGTTYDFVAPTIKGYNQTSFSSSSNNSSATAAYVAANSTNPTITVTYTQQPTAYWNFNFANNTYGTLPPANSLATLSSVASSAGMAIPTPSGALANPLIPGYHIAAYRTYNSAGSSAYFNANNIWTSIPGSSYASLSAAASAAISYAGGVIGSNTPSTPPIFNSGQDKSYYANEVGIMVEANKEIGTIQYSAAPGTSGVTSLPSSTVISNAYGGYVGIASYSNASPSAATNTWIGQSNTAFNVAALSPGFEYQGITAPDGKEYTGYTNFVAPSNNSAGSVTLYARDTKTGVVTPSKATIPAITIGAMRSGAYTDTTSYGSLAAGSNGYGSTAVGATATSMTGLLQALGFVFPYGESGAPISNNNTFTVDVQPWQQLKYSGSYAAGTPGTGSGTSAVAGSAYGNFNKISGFLSNATGTTLASEASQGGSAGKDAWTNYTSAVNSAENSAAAAAGSSAIPVFTGTGSNMAVNSSMGYNVSLVAYNASSASSYYPATSTGFVNAASYAGTNYTSVLDSNGNETDQRIDLQFTPKSQAVVIKVAGSGVPSSGTTLFTAASSGYTGFTNTTGAPISSTTNSAGSTFINTAVSSAYSGGNNSNVSKGYYLNNYTYGGDNSSYATLSAATSAHPYLDNIDGNTQEFDANYAADKTSIWSQSEVSVKVGVGVQASSILGNSSHSTAFTNADGTSNGYLVNGSAISYTITDSKGNQVGAATNISDGTTVIGKGLGPGSYTITFTVLDKAGAKITSSTKLTVSTFSLPFTGAEGLVGIASAASLLAIGAFVILLFRRKKDDEVVEK